MARPGVWIVLAMVLLGLVATAVVVSSRRSAGRVLILASSLDDQGKDAGPGLEVLLSDCMEMLAGATVTHASALPSPTDLQRLPPDTRLVRFSGSRSGDQLALTLEWSTVDRVRTGKPWSRDVLDPQEPLSAMRHLVQRWPLPLRFRQLDALLPTSSRNFWLLLESLSIRDDRSAASKLEATQRLVEAEPRCATAWTVLGDHLYRSLWVDPRQAGIGLNSRTHHAFQKAVDLVPGHPRATFLWSMMLTDTGNQSMALQALKDAIRLRPDTPDLYLGIAYAGRTSGLLEAARRALARRASLLGPLAPPSAWFAETTYLYLGDLEAFGQELAKAGSLRQDASIFFYKGYLALLQGQNAQALDFMRSGSDPGMLPTHFRDLCRVYRAYLEGRSRDGLVELRAMDEIRGKLHIPDGEWTFKEAEAYGILGDADRGVDCATRAFVQGFSCATWYETSPFLAKVRTHPRWPTLRRNIRERQAVLEGSFPPSAFGH
jgi:hypothetical protein